MAMDPSQTIEQKALEFFKDRYADELELKEKINARLTFNLALLTLLANVAVTFLKDFPRCVKSVFIRGERTSIHFPPFVRCQFWLAMRISVAHDEFPMIRANCRARFTAADFDFIVRTLARSQTDQ